MAEPQLSYVFLTGVDDDTRAWMWNLYGVIGDSAWRVTEVANAARSVAGSVAAVADQFQWITSSLNTYLPAITDALNVGLRTPFWACENRLREIAEALRAQVLKVQFPDQLDIRSVAGLDAARMGELAAALSSLARLVDWITALSPEQAAALAQGLTSQMIGADDELSKTELGKAPVIGQKDRATRGGADVQAQHEYLISVLSNKGASPGAMDSYISAMRDGWDAVVGIGAALAGTGEWTDQDPSGRIVAKAKAEGKKAIDAAVAWLEGWLGLYEPATPENVLERAGKQLAIAGAFGVGAHAVSSALKAIPLVGDALSMTGIAAIMAEFAGYKEILGPLHGLYHERSIGVPWRYRVNEMLTPYMPMLGDLIRYETKRIPGRPIPFDLQLAREGFSPEWRAAIVDDMFTEPGMRELLRMADAADVDEAWLARKLERLGFSDADVPLVVESVKLRSKSSWINSHVRALVYQFRDGLLNEPGLRTALEGLPIREWTAEAIVSYAGAERARELAERQVALLRDQYYRDQLTDEEYQLQLAVVMPDAGLADLTFKLARTARYRRVYLKTPSDEARAAVSTYRSAFVAGLVTDTQLRAVLTMAELESDVIGLTVDLLSQQRDRAQLAELRAYGLPGLRDRLVNGEIKVADYRAALKAMDFPQVWLSAEVEYASLLADRAAEQRTRSERLPAARRAYVLGLIGADTLKRLMQEAGLTAGAITGQMAVLYEDRQGQAERIAKAVEAQAAKVRRDYESRLAAERQTTAAAIADAERAQRATEAERARADKLQAQIDKLGMTENAKALVKELQKGRKADIARVDELSLAVLDELTLLAAASD